MWQLSKGCELVDLQKGHLVARFYSKEDYLKVLEGGPWMVLGHYLAISKWHPNFVPSDTEVSTTMVWVRFPNIPIEVFKEPALMPLGNTVGKAIKVDTTSTEVIRGQYVRVYVEVNLTKPLKLTIFALGRKSTVEYESLYKICFQCGKFGDRGDLCPLKKPVHREGQHEKADANRGKMEEPDVPISAYGPWILPAHVRQKQQLAE